LHIVSRLFKRVNEKTNFRLINETDRSRRCARKNQIAFGQIIVWWVDLVLVDVGLGCHSNEYTSD
jgi:hypothetical protein